MKSDLPGPAPKTVAAPGIFLRGGGRYTKSMPPTICSRATVLPAHEHKEKINISDTLAPIPSIPAGTKHFGVAHSWEGFALFIKELALI